jgi:hypothetical protein
MLDRWRRGTIARGSYTYAVVSVMLSLCSLAAFGLYQHWHSTFIKPLQPNEMAWLVDIAKTASVWSACFAVLMSAIAVLRGPRLVGVAAAVLALASCITIPVSF